MTLAKPCEVMPPVAKVTTTKDFMRSNMRTTPVHSFRTSVAALVLSIWFSVLIA